MERFEGIIPALVTPFDRDGELDLPAMRKHLAFLKRAGCTGLFVGGSTGEGFLQNYDERARFAEAVVKESAGEMAVVVHVGAMDLREAVQLARHAGRIGAQGVSSVAPFYYPQTLEMIRAYYEKIATATDLPFIIYWFGQQVEGISPERFIDALGDLPNLWGVKVTIVDFYTMQMIKALSGDRLKVFGGVDRTALVALVMGADGLVGSTYNVLPELFVRLWRAVRAGDLAEAMKVQREVSIISHRRDPWLVNQKKVALGMRGIDVGDVRLPLLPPAPEDVEEIRAMLVDHQVIPGDDDTWLRI